MANLEEKILKSNTQNVVEKVVPDSLLKILKAFKT